MTLTCSWHFHGITAVPNASQDPSTILLHMLTQGAWTINLLQGHIPEYARRSRISVLQPEEDAQGEGEKEASDSEDEPQPKKKRKKGKSGKVTGKQKHRDASFFAGLLKQE